MYIDNVFFNIDYLFRVVLPEGRTEHLTALIFVFDPALCSRNLSVPTHRYNAHAVLCVATIWTSVVLPTFDFDTDKTQHATERSLLKVSSV